MVVSASIAASVLVCISTIYFLNQKSEKGIRIEFNTIAEQLDNKRLEDVTLITSNEQVKLMLMYYIQKMVMLLLTLKRSQSKKIKMR